MKKRSGESINKNQKVFILILSAIFLIELVLVVDYSFTGNAIVKTLEKTLVGEKSGDLKVVGGVDYCEENDRGNWLYDLGTTEGTYNNGTNFSFTDYCVNDLLIKEYWCEGNFTHNSSVYNCSNYDSVCEDGACVPPFNTSCYDSDGGNRQFTKGVIWEDNSPQGWDRCLTFDGSISYVQSCNGDNCYLEERVCRGLGYGNNYFECPGGCDDGACLPKLHEDCDEYAQFTNTSVSYKGHKVKVFSRGYYYGSFVRIKVKTSMVEEVIPNYIYDYESIKYDDFMITIQHIGDYVGFCFNDVNTFCPYCLDLIEETNESNGCDLDREQYGYPGSYYVQGSVGIYTDICFFGILSEQICLENGNGGVRYYTCPTGCKEGKCISCGDLNSDGTTFSTLDLTYLVDYIYRNGTIPDPWQSADMNGDSQITDIDLTIMQNYLFGGSGVKPTCKPNTYCGTTPAGRCSGYNFCLNGQWVGNRCDACGCPSGQTCKKVKGIPTCTGGVVKRAT